jgi:hypothetical protein
LGFGGLRNGLYRPRGSSSRLGFTGPWHFPHPLSPPLVNFDGTKKHCAARSNCWHVVN